MKLLIFFSFLSFCLLAKSKTILEFEKVSENKEILVYQSLPFEKPACANQMSCSLFLGEVGDSAKVSLNGSIIYNDLENYTKFESLSLHVPPSLFKKKNVIIVETKDFNNTLKGLLSSQIYIAAPHSVRKSSNLDWWVRTGIVYSSIYTLFMLIIWMGFFLIVNFDKRLMPVIIYSVVSILYLFSFSEVPRYFFNAEILSGAIHFPLRLFQDFWLVYLFRSMLSKKEKKGFFTLISALYIVAISMMIVPALFGVVDYLYHEKVIMYAAPLVAFPMGYALWLSSRLRDDFERKTLSLFTLVLFIFQLNDLFVFWRLIDSYFTVKFYIPLVVMLLIFIFLLRRVQEFRNNEILAAKSNMALQLAHDIKAPVAVMETCLDQLKEKNLEIFSLLKKAVQRVNEISNSFLPGYQEAMSFDFEQLIDEVFEEKRRQFPDFNFIKDPDRTGDYIVHGIRSEVFRMMSNLIQNSVEASSEKKDVVIQLKKKEGMLIVKIIDLGKGIPEQVLSRIGELGNSFGKAKGSGIGLFHMKQTMTKQQGSYQVKSSNSGTVVSLEFPSIS